MNPQQQPITLSTHQPSFATRLQHSKALVAMVAVLGVTVMALAAALVVNRSEAQTGMAASMTPTSLVSTADVPAAPKLIVTQPARASANTRTHSGSAPVQLAQTSRVHSCTDCGTVEAVTAVQRQGHVNGVAVGNTTVGLGTVAGGVVGGLLGNQMGSGNGKTAMTVLGVAGGAYAGNAVEKNMKKVTVYDVRVRMADGSRRHLEVSSAVAVGSKVIVEGKNLRMAPAAG